jgi:putative ABC transport system substrate-binding protein
VDNGAVALFAFGSPFMNPHSKTVADLARHHELPLFSVTRDWVQAGALEAYAPPFGQIYRRAAEQALMVVNGADPAELPVEQPTRFDLIVNLATAEALALRIPPHIMDQVNEAVR